MAAWAELATMGVEVQTAAGWVDITDHVLDFGGAGLDIERGRQTEVDEIDPTRVVLTLNNADAVVPAWRVADAFDRTTSSGWGTTDTGHTWSTSGGAASDYNVAAGVATASVDSLNASRRTTTNTAVYDVDAAVTVSTSAVASGVSFYAAIMIRHSSSSNLIVGQCRFGTDQTITARIEQRVVTVDTTLADATVPGLTYTAGTRFRMRMWAVGTDLKLKIWPADTEEPREWHAEGVDASGFTAGEVGTRSLLPAGVTTSLPVVLSYEDLEVVDPVSRAGRFTTGAVQLAQAMPIRVYEVLGYRRFGHYTGEIETIEAVSDPGGNLERVTLTAIDRPGRMERAPTFSSTLGAAVAGGAGSTLQAYYPLDDGAAPARDIALGRPPLPVFSLIGPHPYDQDLLAMRAGPAVPGDDLAGTPLWDPDIFASAVYSQQHLLGSLGTPLTLTSGQTLALVAWAKLDDTGITTTTPPTVMQLTHATSALSGIAYIGLDTSLRWVCEFAVVGAGWSTSVSSGADLAHFGDWTMVSAWFGLGVTPIMAVGDQIYTGTTSGSPPASVTLSNISIGRDAAGSIGHAQVYVGTTYTQAAHLDQLAVGTTGLAGQRTDERIATLASYAGIAAPLLQLDRGASYMQRAELAGKRPIEAMRDAVETEQGRLFADGEGRLVFHGRTRIYNV